MVQGIPVGGGVGVQASDVVRVGQGGVQGGLQGLARGQQLGGQVVPQDHEDVVEATDVGRLRGAGLERLAQVRQAARQPSCQVCLAWCLGRDWGQGVAPAQVGVHGASGRLELGWEGGDWGERGVGSRMGRHHEAAALISTGHLRTSLAPSWTRGGEEK